MGLTSRPTRPRSHSRASRSRIAVSCVPSSRPRKPRCRSPRASWRTRRTTMAGSSEHGRHVLRRRIGAPARGSTSRSARRPRPADAGAHARSVLAARRTRTSFQRLQRRAAPAALNAGRLPLVRIDRSVEPGAATPGAAVFGPSTQATDGGTATRSAQRVETASAFAGSLAARHAPGISHASTFVERRSERNHAVDMPVAARLLARADHATTPSTFAPAIITRAAATSVLQRVADAGNRARVAAPRRRRLRSPRCRFIAPRRQWRRAMRACKRSRR